MVEILQLLVYIRVRKMKVMKKKSEKEDSKELEKKEARIKVAREITPIVDTHGTTHLIAQFPLPNLTKVSHSF